MTRLVPVTLLMAVLTASRVASADLGTTLPSGSTIAWSKLEVFTGPATSTSTDDFKVLTSGTTELLHYFNLAHCNCAKAPDKAGKIGHFRYLLQLANPSNTAGVSGVVPLDFWVGSNCTEQTQRNDAKVCKKLTTVQVPNIEASLPTGYTAEFSLFDIVNGKQYETEACQQIDNVNSPIYGFANSTGGGADAYDFYTTQVAGKLSTDTSTGSGLDTKPPALPNDIDAQPAENGIYLSWDPQAADSDVKYYQALCADMDDLPARARTGDEQYNTTTAACGLDLQDNEKPTATPLANDDIAVTPGGAFASLDARYLCGTANSGTASSMQISGLKNGQPYKVILLAVDLHGNFKATYLDHAITPQPVTDFWEDLHNNGSTAEGGLCLLAETYGDDSSLTNALRGFRDGTLGRSTTGRWLVRAYYATLGHIGGLVHGSLALRVVAGVVLAPLVALALLWYWLSLPGLLAMLAIVYAMARYRRALRRALANRLVMSGATTALVVMLGFSRAHAGGYEPYWEESGIGTTSTEELDEEGAVHWLVGVRAGPYTPEIDKQVGGNPGPYEKMFGNFRVLPMLDIDRVVWSGFGQVAVGGTGGYLQRTARPYSQTGMDGTVRAPGEKNKFSMIPLALTATYRFTYLDDEYGIPLVPYVRGGLSYYIWWITTPNGHYARVCDEAGECGDKALGASLGVQGSIGLAIRAERIDADTARSMRNSGVQHAGIYGELSIAKVDGFGNDKKLSVGDRTWFAGVNFEF